MKNSTHPFLICLALLLYSPPSSSQWFEQSKHLPQQSLSNANDGYGTAVAIDGKYAVIGSGDSEFVRASGIVYILENTNSGWQTIAKLTQSNRSPNDSFGKSVAIFGDNVVVGAYREDDNGDNSGSAYIFEKPTSGWVDMTQTAKLTASDSESGDQFGRSVAVYGNNIVVGADFDDDGIGSAYVFEKPTSDWVDMTETAKLTAIDGNVKGRFGRSVAFYDNKIVVGAILGNDNKSGAAYVFEKPTSGWVDMTQTAKLTASDGEASDFFGGSTAISGDNIIIGAETNNINGAAYVFEKPTSGWVDMTQTAKLISSDGSTFDNFGHSVAIFDNDIVVGSYFHKDGLGSSYVFEKPNSGWIDMTQTAKLTASDGEAVDFFGWSVDTSDGHIVIGALFDDDNGNTSGSAYIFEKPTTGWVDMTQTTKTLPEPYLNSNFDQYGGSVDIDKNYAIVGSLGNTDAYVLEKTDSGWKNIAVLSPSSDENDLSFGKSVAISGDVIVIGANNHYNNKGSAFVFVKPMNGWVNMTQTAMLTASDGSNNDHFGHSLAIYESSIVVGAFGVGNGFSQFGAAYVFEKPTNGWIDMTQVAKLTASDGTFGNWFGYSVAISSTEIVVGASFDDDNGEYSGSAYVFVKPTTGWVDMVQTAKLTPSDGTTNDQFGFSLAIYNNNIAIGARPMFNFSNTNNGSVYVFEKPTEGWTDMNQTAKLIQSDTDVNDDFGFSVSISEKEIVTGAIRDDDNGEDSGSIYIFEKPESGWTDMTQTDKLIAPDGTDMDLFGFSVAISGGELIVGAIGDDENGDASGAAYIFESGRITAIESAESHTLVNLYPNPVTNVLTVSLPSLQDKYKIEVFNINGQIIKQINVLNQTQIKIDVSSYEKGIYLLKYSTEKEIELKRFIKL